MEKFTKDIFIVSKLASCIASDNFEYLDSQIQNLRSIKFNALKIYETILQSYLFCGFPAALESLKIFKKHYPNFNKPKSGYNVQKLRKIGESNCKLIYKKNYKKLIENINFNSKDLKDWMLIEGYGKVMGRDGLSLIEREFINVSILCTRYYENQLYSHIKGCINLGADKNDLHELLNIIKKTASAKNVTKGLKLLNQISK